MPDPVSANSGYTSGITTVGGGYSTGFGSGGASFTHDSATDGDYITISSGRGRGTPGLGASASFGEVYDSRGAVETDPQRRDDAIDGSSKGATVSVPLGPVSGNMSASTNSSGSTVQYGIGTPGAGAEATDSTTYRLPSWLHAITHFGENSNPASD